jgi:hypothetical protein
MNVILLIKLINIIFIHIKYEILYKDICITFINDT